MKRQSIYVFLLLWSALSFTGCKPTKVQDQPKSIQELPNLHCGLELRRGTPTFKDPIATCSGILDGDCLALGLSYSGGCKEHAFDLYWDGTWGKSIPPIAYLSLGHQANDDDCEAIKSEKLLYSLASLRQAGTSEIFVDIIVPGLPMVRVDYNYGEK